MILTIQDCLEIWRI